VSPEAPGPAPCGPSTRHVLFRAAGRRFALPLAEVREVVLPPRSFVRVPRAPAEVRGVMNLRGRVVTVVDFARLVGLGEEAFEPATARVLLLEGAVRDLGILVGGVTGIGTLPAVEPAPAGSRPEVVGLAAADGEAVTCLSVERLLVAIGAAFPAPR
jgi:purine-binding chemotaxis protein CheW